MTEVVFVNLWASETEQAVRMNVGRNQQTSEHASSPGEAVCRASTRLMADRVRRVLKQS